MPIARYFVVVGSALMALLLIVGWSSPDLPASSPDRPEIIDRTIIRIRSERKWPEKVVLDTNQPMILPPSTGMSPAQDLVEQELVVRLADEMTEQTGVDAPATPEPVAQRIDAHRQPPRAKRRPLKAFRSTHVAGVRERNGLPTLGTGEAWADRPAISMTASHKPVARRDSWMSWHFPEAN
jgi:hypothetical protein